MCVLLWLVVLILQSLAALSLHFNACFLQASCTDYVAVLTTDLLFFFLLLLLLLLFVSSAQCYYINYCSLGKSLRYSSSAESLRASCLNYVTLLYITRLV